MKENVLKKLNIITFVVIIAAVAALVYVIAFSKSRPSLSGDKRLAAIVQSENEKLSYEHDFHVFMRNAFSKRADEVSVRSDDIRNLSLGSYENVQISMWDDSLCTPEWYEVFFAKKLLNTNYNISSPQELFAYLNSCFSSENEVSKIHLCLEPKSFEEQYYENIYYDAEPASYEEYLMDELIPLINENKNVAIDIFLPIKPLSYFAEMSKDEFDDLFGKWYSFLMMLKWCDNVRVSYLGAEEWLITREDLFTETGELKRPVLENAYLNEYAYEEYTVNAPELKEKSKQIASYMDKLNHGWYDWSGFEEDTLVFFGDSIFSCGAISEFNIPEYLSQYTGSLHVNRAIPGTLATSGRENSFLEILEDSLAHELSEYANEDPVGEKLCVFINYGTNDYFSGIPLKDKNDELNEETFEGALRKGVQRIKEVFPESKVVLLTPYTISIGNFGKDKYDKKGGRMADYISSVEKVADDCGVISINMKKLFSGTETESREYLRDGVHPATSKAILFSRIIYEKTMEALQ